MYVEDADGKTHRFTQYQLMLALLVGGKVLLYERSYVQGPGNRGGRLGGRPRS